MADVFLGRVVRVMLFGRALTPRCWIKRHFVFFSSRVLSAKNFIERAEKARETARRRQENRADDGVADRQVVGQPAHVWAVAHQRVTYSPHAAGLLPLAHTEVFGIESRR